MQNDLELLDYLALQLTGARIAAAQLSSSLEPTTADEAPAWEHSISDTLASVRDRARELRRPVG